MDMIEPTRPLPTTTASTGFNFVAATLFPPVLLDHDVLREALCIDLRQPELNIENAHRLGAIELGIVEVLAVGAGGQSGKSQQLPAGLAAVSPVHRIGKIAFFRIAPEQIEEELRGERRQLDLVLFERLENRVLLVRRQLVEGLPVSGAAVVVDFANTDSINFLGHEAGLEALLGRAFEPGAAAVI